LLAQKSKRQKKGGKVASTAEKDKKEWGTEEEEKPGTKWKRNCGLARGKARKREKEGPGVTKSKGFHFEEEWRKPRRPKQNRQEGRGGPHGRETKLKICLNIRKGQKKVERKKENPKKGGRTVSGKNVRKKVPEGLSIGNKGKGEKGKETKSRKNRGFLLGKPLKGFVRLWRWGRNESGIRFSKKAASNQRKKPQTPVSKLNKKGGERGKSLGCRKGEGKRKRQGPTRGSRIFLAHMFRGGPRTGNVEKGGGGGGQRREGGRGFWQAGFWSAPTVWNRGKEPEWDTYKKVGKGGRGGGKGKGGKGGYKKKGIRKLDTRKRQVGRKGEGGGRGAEFREKPTQKGVV